MSSDEKKSKEVPKEPIVSDPEEGEETQAESSMMSNRGEDDLHTLIQYILQQDDKRESREQEERERREKAARLEREERAERLAREREWMLKMEEREEERRKAEFVREERRIQREEQMRKDREASEMKAGKEEEERRLRAGLKEREAVAEQQREIRLANAEIHDLHAKQEAYSALLTRLPKFEGKQLPSAFILSLEKQLKDNEIPERKWLGALESCLQGKALSSY